MGLLLGKLKRSDWSKLMFLEGSLSMYFMKLTQKTEVLIVIRTFLRLYYIFIKLFMMFF